MTGSEAPEPPEGVGGAVKRCVWRCVGGLALALGAAGAILPLLPATPFLLVAAFAFSRSSPALHRWLLEHRQFGPLILDWQAHGAIRPRVKIISTIVILATFGLSLALGVNRVVLVIQGVCLVGSLVFILTRPSGPRRDAAARWPDR